MPDLFNGAVCPPAPLLLSACRQRLKCRAGVCQRPSGSEVSGLRQVHSTLLAILPVSNLQCTHWWAGPALRHRLRCHSPGRAVMHMTPGLCVCAAVHALMLHGRALLQLAAAFGGL